MGVNSSLEYSQKYVDKRPITWHLLNIITIPNLVHFFVIKSSAVMGWCSTIFLPHIHSAWRAIVRSDTDSCVRTFWCTLGVSVHLGWGQGCVQDIQVLYTPNFGVFMEALSCLNMFGSFSFWERNIWSGVHILTILCIVPWLNCPFYLVFIYCHS